MERGVRKGRSQLKVASVNLFAGNGTAMLLTLKKYLKADSGPDIVVYKKRRETFSKLRGILQSNGVGPSDFEIMGCLIHDNSVWELVNSSTIKTESCYTKRDSFLFELRLKSNPNTTVTVGNVHLCGGRFDEGHHQNCSEKDSQDLVTAKTEVIHNFIKAGASILLGDFNSDVRHYLNGNANTGQKKYLNDKG